MPDVMQIKASESSKEPYLKKIPVEPASPYGTGSGQSSKSAAESESGKNYKGTAEAKAEKAAADKTYSTSLGEYSPSSSVSSALSTLEKWEKARPGAYKSAYNAQINSLLGDIMNHSFKYNPDEDVLYRQYEKSIVNKALLNKEDAEGKAAARTGGYENSYSKSLGLREYDSSMDELSDLIPELYEAAYGKYRDKAGELEDKLDMLLELDSRDYDKYSDSLDEYYDFLNYLFKKYSTMADDDLNSFKANLSSNKDDRNFYAKLLKSMK